MYVYICASPEWLDRFYSYSVLNSLSIPGGCLVDLNIPAPKTGDLQIASKTHNGNVLENGSILIRFQ
jgi:hypothetical protein